MLAPVSLRNHKKPIMSTGKVPVDKGVQVKVSINPQILVSKKNCELVKLAGEAEREYL